MKTLASRSALATLTFVAAVALGSGTAGAGPDTLPAPNTTPSPAPIRDLASPPPTLNMASAVDACADDAFLSFRTVPAPGEHEVTICGRVTSVAAATFAVAVDGTDPIAVTAAAAANAHPGDLAVVRGRYHRDKSGFEGIDDTRAANGATRWAFDGYVMLNGMLYH